MTLTPTAVTQLHRSVLIKQSFQCADKCSPDNEGGGMGFMISEVIFTPQIASTYQDLSQSSFSRPWPPRGSGGPSVFIPLNVPYNADELKPH